MIKEYLTFKEIKTIVDACVEIEDALVRRFTKDMYLIKFVTNIEIADEITDDEWDKYIQDGTIDKIYSEVKNIGLVDEMIKDALSIENTMAKAELAFEQFLNNANVSIDKVTKGLPKSTKGWESFANKIKGVIDNGNK